MTRWTAWPAWWLGLGAWLYAALSVLELRELDYDPTAPEQPDQVTVAGYVPEQQIRSPIEHMACFAVQGGQWRLISFTAGYLPE